MQYFCHICLQGKCVYDYDRTDVYVFIMHAEEGIPAGTLCVQLGRSTA